MKDKNCPLCKKNLYSELDKGCLLCGMPLEDKSKEFCSFKCETEYNNIQKRI
ncbi:DUF2116 family Zn-ribbon domain-containing protein [Candidatus Woesearchaeota archaeon]|nr:DUF2116 family Zn-ribbon domain-containing protein [Candidatus Woesearchaeota archaeon]